MELEPRTQVPAHATGAVEFVPLSAIDADTTFRLRDEGDVSALASSLGRLGQLAPIELRPMPGAPERYQVVAGFRRIAAIRLLRRERVLARIHGAFSDDDAWALALAQALLTEPLAADAVEVLRARVEAVAPWAVDLLDRVINEPEVEALDAEAPGAAPEPGAPAEAPAAGDEDGEVEVTPEELANDLATRLYEVNADLMVAWESWADLPPEGRRAIVDQARWIAALLPSMEAEEE